MMLASLLASAAVLAAPISAPSTGSYMPGVWSLGETRNCDTGPAWVFLADGYYVEVKLPSAGPFATGIWRDEGGAIAYTHSHMPFETMLTANVPKELLVVSREPDKLTTTTPRQTPLIFHRCPPSSLKAPADQAKH